MPSLNSLVQALAWKQANPSRIFPAAFAAAFLAALAAGRETTPACAPLGTAQGTEGARRGSNGVAYLCARHGEWGDHAYLALAEEEATALVIPSLADQQAASVGRRKAAAARSAEQRKFERELDA